MVIAILGGSGQLGRTFQNHLLATKEQFLAPNRSELNLASNSEISDFFGLTKPSIVINCAAWTNVEGAEQEEAQALKLNGYLPEYLAKEAKNINAIFIHFSSDYVFSGDKEQPWNELHETNPINAYGRTKKFGEDAILAHYPEGSYIIRTAWLYSKYGKNFVKAIYHRAKNTNEDLYVVDDQFGQPTFAGDLCDQVFEVLKSNISPGIYHGTNSGECSWYEFATEIFALIDQDPARLRKISTAELKQSAKRPKYSVLGHQAWENTSVNEMRSWKSALKHSFPEIISSIQTKE